MKKFLIILFLSSLSLKAKIHHNVKITLKKDITTDSTEHIFSGLCKINGNGHKLTLTKNSKIILGPDSLLKFKNIIIDNFNNIFIDEGSEILIGKNVTIIEEV
ncbi:hypothetical protein GF385_00480 [Candidatus Dependentiae bacterium]|nr:hypothetical protein [Candidatus Dependentiae bacterium]